MALRLDQRKTQPCATLARSVERVTNSYIPKNSPIDSIRIVQKIEIVYAQASICFRKLDP